MHSYIPNGHLNIWSYFNSTKLVKWETLSCTFAKVALKGSEIAQNVAKVGLNASLLKYLPKSTFKFQFWKSRQKYIFANLVWSSLNDGQNSFTKFGVKGGENNSKCHKSWSARLLWNGHPNLWSNFISKKFVRRKTPSCIFARVGLKGGQKWNSIMRFR